MALRCMLCGESGSMELASRNKMRIKYVCSCGTMYIESRRKKKVRKHSHRR